MSSQFLCLRNARSQARKGECHHENRPCDEPSELDNVYHHDFLRLRDDPIDDWPCRFVFLLLAFTRPGQSPIPSRPWLGAAPSAPRILANPTTVGPVPCSETRRSSSVRAATPPRERESVRREQRIDRRTSPSMASRSVCNPQTEPHL